MRAAALAACALLGACATVPTPKAVCLPLKAYTAQEQAALAAAVAALPPGSDLIAAVLDYERMRDADRACLAGPSARRNGP